MFWIRKFQKLSLFNCSDDRVFWKQIMFYCFSERERDMKVFEKSYGWETFNKKHFKPRQRQKKIW